MKTSRAQILEAIKNAKTIAVMGHRKGDGDSFGAMCGLFLGLSQLEKEIYLYSEIGLPKNLDFLKNFIHFSPIDSFREVDLLIVEDCSNVSMTSFPELVKEFLTRKIPVLVVDHHQDGDLKELSDLVLIDQTACATCELVYQLLVDCGANIDKQIATCLLTGIETDTSSFQNQNTSKECFDLASLLLGKGARLNTIISKNINAFSVGLLKLYGLAIDRMIYDEKTGIASTYLTFADAESLGATTNDFELIVNNLNQVRDAKLIVLYKQEKPGEVRVSLRTRDKDVNTAEIAKQFGGGGHEKAAGFSLSGNIVVRDGKIAVE